MKKLKQIPKSKMIKASRVKFKVRPKSEIIKELKKNNNKDTINFVDFVNKIIKDNQQEDNLMFNKLNIIPEVADLSFVNMQNEYSKVKVLLQNENLRTIERYVLTEYLNSLGVEQ